VLQIAMQESRHSLHSSCEIDVPCCARKIIHISGSPYELRELIILLRRAVIGKSSQNAVALIGGNIVCVEPMEVA
jgi:hypothetical protein